MTDNEISRLFNQRDRLEAQLRAINQRIADGKKVAGKRYGFIFPPSDEVMTRAIASGRG